MGGEERPHAVEDVLLAGAGRPEVRLVGIGAPHDLHAVAAPVWGNHGELAANSGVQGPASRFDRQAMETVVEPLLEHAREVSLELGWAGLVSEVVER